jgi:predicted nucleotidyltransferase
MTTGSPFPDDAFLARVVERIRAKNEEYDRESASRKDEARREAVRIAKRIAEADLSVEKIILFGSALPGRAFRLDSDIDLAISGGNVANLEGIASKSAFRVDIIELNELRPGIRGLVEKEGVVLYEKDR